MKLAHQWLRKLKPNVMVLMIQAMLILNLKLLKHHEDQLQHLMKTELQKIILL